MEDERSRAWSGLMFLSAKTHIDILVSYLNAMTKGDWDEELYEQFKDEHLLLVSELLSDQHVAIRKLSLLLLTLVLQREQPVYKFFKLHGLTAVNGPVFINKQAIQKNSEMKWLENILASYGEAIINRNTQYYDISEKLLKNFDIGRLVELIDQGNIEEIPDPLSVPIIMSFDCFDNESTTQIKPLNYMKEESKIEKEEIKPKQNKERMLRHISVKKKNALKNILLKPRSTSKRSRFSRISVNSGNKSTKVNRRSGNRRFMTFAMNNTINQTLQLR